MADANIKIVLSNGKEAGKTLNSLTSESVKLNREIKKLEIGSNEWENKTKEFKKINSRLKDVKKEVYDTEKGWSLLNSSIMEMLPFNAQIQKFAGSMGLLGKGIKGTTIATRLFSTALAATGIGLIILAFGALYSWLLKTQQGMDFLAKAGAAIRAVFQVVIDRLVTFTGAMKDLVNLRFGDALEGMKNTFSGIGKEMVNDASAAYKMSGALLEIAQSQKVLDGQRSKSRAEIERLKMISEDQTKSEKDRSEAASKALSIEQDLMDKSIKLAQRKVDALKSENDLKKNLTNEDTNRVIEAEKELADILEDSYGKQTELNNKNNELIKAKAQTAAEYRKEQEEKQKESDDKALKEREEYAKKVIDSEKNLQDKRDSLITDEQDRKIAEIQLAADRELSAFEGNEKQKEEFLILKQKERDAAIDAVIKENNKKAFEDNLIRMEEEQQILEEKVNEKFYEKVITEEDREEQLYQIQKAALEKRLALLVASKSTETLEYQKIYSQIAQLHFDHEEKKTASTKKEEEARKALQQQSLQAAASVFGGFADLLAQDELARKKNFQLIKTLKRAEMAINLYTEISTIWEKSASFGPLQIVIGAAQSALALARFVQGSAQLNAVQFAKGGPVKGPSHDAGGIPFSVSGRGGYEMEGDEIILTKGVYRDPVLRSIASDLNAMGGGKRFTMGGPIIDRGEYRPKPDISTMTNNSQSSLDMRETNNYLKQLTDTSFVIAKNTEMSANPPPIISLQKVRDGLNQLSEVEKEARF